MRKIHHLDLPRELSKRELFIEQGLLEICLRWRIAELSFFGSILRDDFSSESDIDILVTFEEDSSTSLFDLVRMEEEFSTLFGRKVDLISRAAVEVSSNKLRREEILSSAEVAYG